jgi:hypothetical protein
LPHYDESEVRAVVQLLNRQEDRLNRLEANPARESLERGFVQGRQRAMANGFHGEDLERLENWMEQKCIVDHDVAMKASGVSPSTKARILGGIPKEELEALMNGDDDAYLRMSVARVQSEER